MLNESHLNSVGAGLRVNAYSALEFFSGIGGWSAAFKNIASPGFSVQVIGAFDINTLANSVYQYNYGTKPQAVLNHCVILSCVPMFSYPKVAIESLSLELLQSYRADIWAMSPPCQPFTRNNNTLSRDSVDSRSKAFLHLVDVINKMPDPPSFFVLEV